jgi:hypothetical protein
MLCVQDANRPRLNGGTGATMVEALVDRLLICVWSQSALFILMLISEGNRPSPRQKVNSCFSSIYKTVLWCVSAKQARQRWNRNIIVGCAVFPLLDTLLVVLLFEPNNFFFALVVVPYAAMSLVSAITPTHEILPTCGELRVGSLQSEDHFCVPVDTDPHRRSCGELTQWPIHLRRRIRWLWLWQCSGTCSSSGTCSGNGSGNCSGIDSGSRTGGSIGSLSLC